MRYYEKWGCRTAFLGNERNPYPTSLLNAIPSPLVSISPASAALGANQPSVEYQVLADEKHDKYQLLEKGIEKQDIVLAYYPEFHRGFTEFAVA